MNLLSREWRLNRNAAVVLVALLAAAGCSRQDRKPAIRTPQGEEHVRSVIQNLPVSSDMRRALEEGGRGSGIHYPWMDDMKRQRIRKAEVRLEFNVPFHIPYIWSGRPGKFTAVRMLYFERYDSDCAQITSPERLAAFRSSGLEQELQTYAKEQARNTPWFVFEQPIPSASHGRVSIKMMDDEWLPPTPSFLFPLRTPSDSPLVEAVVFPDEVQLDRILTSDRPSSATLNEALVVAAYGPDSCILKSLLKAGADANFRADKGKTPLMYAAEYGMINNVKVLLGAGARVSDQSTDGETALSLARASKHSEIAALLENELQKQ